MPSKQQKRQKALKEKLRGEAAAKQSAKEAAEEAAKAAEQGIGHSCYSCQACCSRLRLFCRPRVAAARTKRINQCNGGRHTADTA